MTWTPDWGWHPTPRWEGKPVLKQLAPRVKVIDDHVPLSPNDPSGLILPWGARAAGSRRRQRARHRQQLEDQLRREIYLMELAPYIHLYRPRAIPRHE